MTHASENITLPQTSFAGDNNNRKITTGQNVTGQSEDHKEPFHLLPSNGLSLADQSPKDYDKLSSAIQVGVLIAQ